MPTQKKREIERNLPLYKILSLLKFTPFMLPVIVLFWQENGMDMFDVYLLQGIYAVFVVLLEVPTGMVADRIGKKTSLLMGLFAFIFAVAVYGSGHCFLTFLWAELVLAVGSCLMSGADSALLYDSLQYLDRESEYQQLEGEARSLAMVGFAVSNLLGGVIAHILSFRATVWITGIGPILALFAVCGLREVQIVRRSATYKAEAAAYLRLIGDALRFVRKQQLVRWHILLFAVLGASSTWLLWLYQPYMTLCGLPVWSFGVIFALFNFFAAFMSAIAHRVSKRFGDQNTLTLLMSLQILPPLLMSLFVTPLSFLFILGHQAVRAFMFPFVQDLVLRHTYEDKRATMLSLCAMSSRLFFALTCPFIGLMGKHLAIPTNMAGQVVMLVVIFAVLSAMYLRIPAKYFTVKTREA
ncbi:MAG: MFS transporter [Elusimicrobiota bacterium]